jgi:hypothetical protein
MEKSHAGCRLVIDDPTMVSVTACFHSFIATAWHKLAANADRRSHGSTCHAGLLLLFGSLFLCSFLYGLLCSFLYSLLRSFLCSHDVLLHYVVRELPR